MNTVSKSELSQQRSILIINEFIFLQNVKILTNIL